MKTSPTRSRRHRSPLSSEGEAVQPFFAVKNADIVQNKADSTPFFQAKLAKDKVQRATDEEEPIQKQAEEEEVQMQAEEEEVQMQEEEEEVQMQAEEEEEPVQSKVV